MAAKLSNERIFAAISLSIDGGRVRDLFENQRDAQWGKLTTHPATECRKMNWCVLQANTRARAHFFASSLSSLHFRDYNFRSTIKWANGILRHAWEFCDFQYAKFNVVYYCVCIPIRSVSFTSSMEETRCDYFRRFWCCICMFCSFTFFGFFWSGFRNMVKKLPSMYTHTYIHTYTHVSIALSSEVYSKATHSFIWCANCARSILSKLLQFTLRSRAKIHFKSESHNTCIAQIPKLQCINFQQCKADNDASKLSSITCVWCKWCKDKINWREKKKFDVRSFFLFVVFVDDCNGWKMMAKVLAIDWQHNWIC